MDWMTLHHLHETELVASTLATAHRRELVAVRRPRTERRAWAPASPVGLTPTGRLAGWWRALREPACVACA